MSSSTLKFRHEENVILWLQYLAVIIEPLFLMENKWFPSEQPCLQGRVTDSGLDGSVYVASIKSSTASFLRRVPLTFVSRTVFFFQSRATFLLRSLSMPTQNKLKRGTSAKTSMLSMQSTDREAFLHRTTAGRILMNQRSLNKKIGFGLAAQVSILCIMMER